MAESKPRVTVISDVVFSTTDKFGREIYLTDDTVQRHKHHAEFTDFDGHRDALKNPQIVGYHTEDTDKRIYLGHPWELDELSLGTRHRMLVILLNDTGGRGKIITAYDRSDTRRPISLGKIIFEDVT